VRKLACALYRRSKLPHSKGACKRDEAAFFAHFKRCASRDLIRQCDLQPGESSGLFIYTGGSVK